MTLELLYGLLAFSFVSSITPGPNNLMLLASGANFGFARSIPHMLGIGIGFTVMIVLVGLGLMQVFDRVPGSYTALKIFSVLYLAWLAWKIANAAAPGKGGTTGTPMTFFQAAAFQWVNPKAWAMALTAISIYAPARDLSGVVLVALVFGAVNVPSITTWLMMGRGIARVLTNPTRLRAFNWTMAALLIASLFPVLLSQK